MIVTINKKYNKKGEPSFALEDKPQGEYSNAGSLIEALNFNYYLELEGYWEDYFKWALGDKKISIINVTNLGGYPIAHEYDSEGTRLEVFKDGVKSIDPL